MCTFHSVLKARRKEVPKTLDLKMLSAILPGALLGAYTGSFSRSPSPVISPTFDSTGSLNFFFQQPLSVTSSRFFIKVKGTFLSDGLLFTLDNNKILIYISDLSRLNIKVKNVGLRDLTLNSPIAIGRLTTFSLDIVDKQLTLKVGDQSLTKVLPLHIDMSSVNKFYLSGSPDVTTLGLLALKARYNYVWIDTKVYTCRNI